MSDVAAERGCGGHERAWTRRSDRGRRSGGRHPLVLAKQEGGASGALVWRGRWMRRARGGCRRWTTRRCAPGAKGRRFRGRCPTGCSLGPSCRRVRQVWHRQLSSPRIREPTLRSIEKRACTWHSVEHASALDERALHHLALEEAVRVVLLLRDRIEGRAYGFGSGDRRSPIAQAGPRSGQARRRCRSRATITSPH